MSPQTKLLQVAQRAEDLGRAVAFYSSLLGASPSGLFDPPGLAFFDSDGVRILLDVNAPSSLIYLGVDDVRRSTAQLRTHGVEIVGEPQLIFHHETDALGPAGTDEWMAFIRDSEGNTIGLVSRHPA